MNCRHCHSPEFVQHHEGRQRKLRFEHGFLRKTSAWEGMPTGILGSAFVCADCKREYRPEGEGSSLYFEILHSASELAVAPAGATRIERRRPGRMSDAEWLKQSSVPAGVLPIEPQARRDAADRAASGDHYQIGVSGTLEADPSMFIRTRNGLTLFVPFTLNAHLWLISANVAEESPPRALQAVVDYTLIAEDTCRRIVERACARQRAYLLEGAPLVPMQLAEIARECGVDDSTVSRACMSVSLRTPKGARVFLKSLFVEAFKAGSALTSVQVRERIAAILSQAGPRPSDASVSKLLELQGIAMARRTVAKYRNDLEHEARERLAVPLDFPEPQYAVFKAEPALSALFRANGVTTFGMVRALTTKMWDELYVAAAREHRELLTRLRLRLLVNATAASPQALRIA